MSDQHMQSAGAGHTQPAVHCKLPGGDIVLVADQTICKDIGGSPVPDSGTPPDAFSIHCALPKVIGSGVVDALVTQEAVCLRHGGTPVSNPAAVRGVGATSYSHPASDAKPPGGQ